MNLSSSMLAQAALRALHMVAFSMCSWPLLSQGVPIKNCAVQNATLSLS